MPARMSTRRKYAWWLPAFGLLLLVAGLAAPSNLLCTAGVFVIATAIRYRRKRPPLWEYVVILALTVAIVALLPSSSPWVAVTPLVLSYVLDYLDERRWKRASTSKSNEVQEGSPPAAADAPHDGPTTNEATPLSRRGPH